MRSAASHCLTNGCWDFFLYCSPRYDGVSVQPLQGSTSITYSMVNDFVHADRVARGFALIYAASSFASVAGPLSFGLLGDAYGAPAAMLAMAVVAVAAILPCCWLRVSSVRAPTAAELAE